MSSLKIESCHDANFFIIGETGHCHFDNLRCCRRQQSRHHDYSWFSVLVSCLDKCKFCNCQNTQRFYTNCHHYLTFNKTHCIFSNIKKQELSWQTQDSDPMQRHLCEKQHPPLRKKPTGCLPLLNIVKFNDCSKKYKLCNMFELHCCHSMLVVDDLVPIWHQDICNHHDDICQSAYIKSSPA